MATIYRQQLFKGYIKPQHGVHGPVRFTFKGLWPDARAKYFQQVSATTSEDEAEAVIVSAMETLIVDWNLMYQQDHPDTAKRGKPVPRTAEVLRKEVMTHVRNHMMNIITFATASDVDPEESILDQIAKIDQKADKRDLAEIMAEADAELVGNSSGALG